MANIGKHLEEWGTGSLGRWYSMAILIVAILASIVPLIIGLINAKVDWWWIVLFPILLSIFVFLCFWQFHKVAGERDDYKYKEGLVFYPHRPDIETLKKFIREHEVIYAFFPMGDSVNINHLFEEYKGKFQHVIVMDAEGRHIQAIPERYYVNDSAGLKKGVNVVADAIRANNIDLKLWDGCFPFSLFIGNPLSQVNNGGILLEVHVPFTAGSDRPAMIFKQKDYPDLFQRLKESYDKVLKTIDECHE